MAFETNLLWNKTVSLFVFFMGMSVHKKKNGGNVAGVAVIVCLSNIDILLMFCASLILASCLFLES